MEKKPRYRKYNIFLKKILTSKNDIAAEFVKASNSDVIKSLVEIAINILKGSVPLTEKDVKFFMSEKNILKKLNSERFSLIKKRSLLAGNIHVLKHMLQVIYK